MTYELKRVRLPGGNFITRKLPCSEPADLATAKPEEIWTCGDKREILIRDMELSHLINAMRTIYNAEYTKLREAGASGFNIIDPEKNKNSHTRNRVRKICRQTRPQYAVMCDELDYRMGRKERPKPTTTKRQFDL